MANFIKLTCAAYKRPIWVNLDLVESFARDPKSKETVIVYLDVAVDQMEVTRRVKETPEHIMEALIEARGNYGYGLGATP